nr:hypothetical protein [Tanacetum cinerariifolium]
FWECYIKIKEEHEMHLGLILELLKKEKLYAEFYKCEFWLQVVQFLGHVINGDSIHVDPSKIKAFKNWEALELHLNDYDCEICYHPSKANVVADPLIKKEKIKPKRVRAMNMTIQSSIRDMILAAQNEAYELVDAPAKMLRGLDEQMECKVEHCITWTEYGDMYWWTGMKKNIALYERIAMDFVMKLPRTSSGHDVIWVIVDRLTNSARLLPMREDYKMDSLARLYLNEILARTRIMQETTKKISQIKDRLKAARDRQKSYADKKRKPIEFSVEIIQWEFKKLKRSRIPIVK